MQNWWLAAAMEKAAMEKAMKPAVAAAAMKKTMKASVKAAAMKKPGKTRAQLCRPSMPTKIDRALSLSARDHLLVKWIIASKPFLVTTVHGCPECLSIRTTRFFGASLMGI